jgi:hypothetical protein
VEGKALEPVSKKLKQQVLNETFAQLGAYLYNDYKVDVDTGLLARLYGGER